MCFEAVQHQWQAEQHPNGYRDPTKPSSSHKTAPSDRHIVVQTSSSWLPACAALGWGHPPPWCRCPGRCAPSAAAGAPSCAGCCCSCWPSGCKSHTQHTCQHSKNRGESLRKEVNDIQGLCSKRRESLSLDLEVNAGVSWCLTSPWEVNRPALTRGTKILMETCPAACQGLQWELLVPEVQVMPQQWHHHQVSHCTQLPNTTAAFGEVQQERRLWQKSEYNDLFWAATSTFALLQEVLLLLSPLSVVLPGIIWDKTSHCNFNNCYWVYLCLKVINSSWD